MNVDTTSSKTYAKNLTGVGCIGIGAFLLIEHIWSWNEIAFFDFIGHEWLGFILILIGMGLNITFNKDRLSKEIGGKKDE